MCIDLGHNAMEKYSKRFFAIFDIKKALTTYYKTMKSINQIKQNYFLRMVAK